MTWPFGDDSEYEYRVGYQYRNGRVNFTIPEREREALETLGRFQAQHRWLLLIDPWLERRQILKWRRVPWRRVPVKPAGINAG